MMGDRLPTAHPPSCDTRYVRGTHYDTLGISPTATADDVRRAYTALARRHHPDAGGSDDAMYRLNEAWAILGDARRRARYDRSVGLVEAPSHHDDVWENEPAPDAVPASAFAEPDSNAASGLVDRLSLLAVLVPLALGALSVLFGMFLYAGALLGFAVFCFFLTGVATVARVLLAMRAAIGSR
jgi:DnaJ domain